MSLPLFPYLVAGTHHLKADDLGVHILTPVTDDDSAQTIDPA